MARICAACRQPVSRDARDHDCPAEDDAGAPVPDFYRQEVVQDEPYDTNGPWLMEDASDR
jgi:hypothetical protein